MENANIANFVFIVIICIPSVKFPIAKHGSKFNRDFLLLGRICEHPVILKNPIVYVKNNNILCHWGEHTCVAICDGKIWLKKSKNVLDQDVICTYGSNGGSNNSRCERRTFIFYLIFYHLSEKPRNRDKNDPEGRTRSGCPLEPPLAQSNIWHLMHKPVSDSIGMEDSTCMVA